MEHVNMCPICYEVFSDSAIPKVLKCGHTLCTNCLSKQLQTPSPKCPECQKDFETKDISKFPTNFGLLHLIKSFDNLTGEKEDFRNNEISSLKRKLSDQKSLLNDQKISLEEESKSLEDDIVALDGLEKDQLTTKDLITVTSRVKSNLFKRSRRRLNGWQSISEPAFSALPLLSKDYETGSDFLREINRRTTGGRQLWAVGTVNGEEKFGKVESYGANIIVHSLSTLCEEEKEQERSTVLFQELKSCILYMKWNTFLKIQVSKTGLDEFIVVDLLPNLLTQQFIYLCTGEMGPTYKGCAYDVKLFGVLDNVTLYNTGTLCVKNYMLNGKETTGKLTCIINHSVVDNAIACEADKLYIFPRQNGAFIMRNYKNPRFEYSCSGKALLPFALQDKASFPFRENECFKISDCGLFIPIRN